MNVNSTLFVGSYYRGITQCTVQTTKYLVNQMHSLFKEEENLLPWRWTHQVHPKTLFTNECELNIPRHCYVSVVPGPSGMLAPAYYGHCEAYPGIPKGTGNEW